MESPTEEFFRKGFCSKCDVLEQYCTVPLFLRSESCPFLLTGVDLISISTEGKYHQLVSKVVELGGMVVLYPH